MPPAKSRSQAAKKVRRKERKNVAHGHAHIRKNKKKNENNIMKQKIK